MSKMMSMKRLLIVSKYVAMNEATGNGMPQYYTAEALRAAYGLDDNASAQIANMSEGDSKVIAEAIPLIFANKADQQGGGAVTITEEDINNYFQ